MGSLIRKKRGRPRKNQLPSFQECLSSEEKNTERTTSVGPIICPDTNVVSPLISQKPNELILVDNETDESSDTKETRRKINIEIQALRQCCSKLVQIPEAIDLARELRLLVVKLEALSTRIGNKCQRCGLRSHVFGDGEHECLNGSPYSGESNLSTAGK